MTVDILAAMSSLLFFESRNRCRHFYIILQFIPQTCADHATPCALSLRLVTFTKCFFFCLISMQKGEDWNEVTKSVIELINNAMHSTSILKCYIE